MWQCSSSKTIACQRCSFRNWFGFLFAAPVLNPIVLASTWIAFPIKPGCFGPDLSRFSDSAFPICSSGFAPGIRIVSGCIAGGTQVESALARVGLLDRRSGLVGLTTNSSRSLLADDSPQPSQLLRHSTREFLGLLSLLVVGCALAAAVQTWLPRSWLLALGSSPTVSVLALMLLALVVSVCSSVDAFLALGFAAQVTPEPCWHSCCWVLWSISNWQACSPFFFPQERL